jgi:hypothetical protein
MRLLRAVVAGFLIVLPLTVGAGRSTAWASFQEVQVVVFAPYSTGLTAGKGGILVNASSCPDDVVASPDTGSQDLEITQPGFTFSFKTPPVMCRLTLADGGYTPPSYSVPPDTRPGLTTFSITNRGKKEHRFAGRFITSQTAMVVEGKDFTIPPPMNTAAFMVITEGSTFNIGGERKYPGSYVGIKPGSSASITLDLDQYVRIPELSTSKVLEVRCDLPGHQDSFLIRLPGAPAEKKPVQDAGAEKKPVQATAAPAVGKTRTVKTDPAAVRRYRWRKSRGGPGTESDGITIKDVIRDGSRGKSVGKAPDGPGEIGVNLSEGGNGVSGGHVLDAPGSKNIHIEIDEEVGSTTYAGLTFTTPCVLDILRDGTLTARKAGVTATDEVGKKWISRRIGFNGRFINAFLPR